MRKRIALIDADGILYAAALKGQTMCDGKPLQLLDISQVLRNARERIEEQAGWVDAQEVFICLSDRRNFRTDILPSYKGNRKGADRPILLDELRNLIVEGASGLGSVMLIPGLEADDVCGIAAGVMQGRGHETIIVSPDKDLLQIPGLVCTPLANGKHPISEVTERAGNRFHIMQTLTGDVVDNYKGCPGIGPRKAGMLLDYCEAEGFTLARTWGEVIDQYCLAGLDEVEVLTQARVARILRVGDWDQKAKRPILFDFPLNGKEVL